MNIQGIEILEQTTIWTPTLIGILIPVIGFLSALFLITAGCEKNNFLLFACGVVFAALSFVHLVPLTSDKPYLIFTRPDYIVYTAEINDDAAWKELVTKYDNIKQVYEGREIYTFKEEL